MEYRNLGASGLEVPALSFGAGTFGGSGPLFGHWGRSDAQEARRLVDICLEAGVTLFDTADVYSNGASEEVLGEALEGRRDQVFISTKTALPMGDGPNDAGTSRSRLIRTVEDALRRLRTDYIDLLQLHAFDAGTPIEEVLSSLDDLVHAGKVRYVGVSNFSGWQVMKSLAIAEKQGWPRYAAHQVYYSLVGRDYEWDLMPLGLDQGVGALIWSPLGWGRLTGKIRRGQKLPATQMREFQSSQAIPLPFVTWHIRVVLIALCTSHRHVEAPRGRSSPGCSRPTKRLQLSRWSERTAGPCRSNCPMESPKRAASRNGRRSASHRRTNRQEQADVAGSDPMDSRIP
jgi:aryl-alcohol dehydrogenase-like predicted oxidoreductase